MDSVILWVLEHTRLKSVVDFFDGKKQTIASLGAALIASGTIAVKWSEQGTPYLLHVASTPEFTAASIGWVGFFNSLKGEKIRAEIAVQNSCKQGDSK